MLNQGPEFKKLRRDKVRRLSFVDRLCDKTPDSEMACVQSDDDQEDEYHPCDTKSKRIKLPRKVTFYCAYFKWLSVLTVVWFLMLQFTVF